MFPADRSSRLRHLAPDLGGNAYGFLTTEPNALVAPIHPKAMPVMLDDEDYDLWLNGSWEQAQRLVAPYPSQLMNATA